MIASTALDARPVWAASVPRTEVLVCSILERKEYSSDIRLIFAVAASAKAEYTVDVVIDCDLSNAMRYRVPAIPARSSRRRTRGGIAGSALDRRRTMLVSVTRKKDRQASSGMSLIAKANR